MWLLVAGRWSWLSIMGGGGWGWLWMVVAAIVYDGGCGGWSWWGVVVISKLCGCWLVVGGGIGVG